jgi:hypothetical protein
MAFHRSVSPPACSWLFAGSWISELPPDNDPYVQNYRISLCAPDRGNSGAVREVMARSRGRLALKNRLLPLRKGTAPEIRLSLILILTILILTSWCKAGMKPISCMIWVLGLLLAIASVDTVPDPPAVNPRAVGVAYILCDFCGDVHERRLNSVSSISLLLQVRWIAFTSADEPNLPTDRIVLTGFATDPSPPPV